MADYRSINAKRRFGQNFLVDERSIDRIVSAIKIEPGDTIMEIGPGRGAITERLLEQDARVMAIEIDRDLHVLLEERFGSNENFDLVKGDILEIDLQSIANGSVVKIVGNLPYNISTPILSRLIDFRSYISEAVLMFQREVVDRLTASPEKSDRGYMSVKAQNAFDMERLFDVPPGAFRPAPKVWSSVISAVPRPLSELDDPSFDKLVSTAFLQKRKTLRNNLSRSYDLNRLVRELPDLDLSRRAETLSLDEWKAVFTLTR